MNVVERLNQKYYKKLKYYLTKTDSVSVCFNCIFFRQLAKTHVIINISCKVEKLIQLLKVSQQLTTNLAQRVKNTHGFYISPIFLTFEREDPHPLYEINEIGKLCFDIENLVRDKVQVRINCMGFILQVIYILSTED
jgi:hypothetical protein